MVQVFLKILLALIFWGIFSYVIIYVNYPESLTQASTGQLLYFFIPLFLAIIFTVNILLRSIIRSILIAFGVIILLVLKALDSLNLVSAGLTIIAIGLLFSYFNPSTRSARSGPSGLTSGSNIPKLKSLRRKR